MILWAVLTVMIAVASSAFTIPLVRRREEHTRAGIVEILKGQLEDLDAQVASGAMRPEEADGLRVEIKRRLLEEARQVETGAPRSLSKRALPWLALGVSSVVAVVATGLYAMFGSPAVPSATPVPVSNESQAAAQANPHAAADIKTLIGQLEAKMRTHPGDPEGWRMLGWSYMQTGRPADAATAYARAATLDPKNAGYLSAEGEALTQAADGQVTPAALNVFRRAIALDASDPRARYFLAAYKDEQGDHAGAVADWIALLKSAPADATWAIQVRRVIERTARQYAIDLSGRLPPLASPSSTETNATASPGPTADQVAAASGMSDNDRQTMIRGMVERLAAELKENPRNQEGWVRLMRAQMVMGERTAAAAAYQDARKAFAGQPAQTAALQAAARNLQVPGA